MGLEDRDAVAQHAKVTSARQTGRSRSDDGHVLSGWRAGFEQLDLALEDVVGGMALQQGDLDRLLVAVIQHARPLAQHFHGAGARAGMAERVGFENDARRAAQVAGRDLLDESRNVDVGGTGLGAGRIVTEQALVGLEQRVVWSERRRDVGEVALQLLVRQDRSRITHRDAPLPTPPAVVEPRPSSRRGTLLRRVRTPQTTPNYRRFRKTRPRP